MRVYVYVFVCVYLCVFVYIVCVCVYKGIVFMSDIPVKAYIPLGQYTEWYFRAEYCINNLKSFRSQSFE